MPNGCCRAHGGKAARGIAAGPYRHGGYSKYLPKVLLKDLDAFHADPNRLSVQHEIDILRINLSEVLQTMYKSDQQFAVEAVSAAARNVRRAARQLNTHFQGQAFDRMEQPLSALLLAVESMGEAMSPAVAKSEGRDGVVKITMALDRLLKTENSVKLAERGMVTLEAVLARDRVLMDAWKAALDAQVRDVAVRTLVLTAVARLYADAVGRRAPAALDAGDGDVLDVEPPSSAD
jgi:hypothetical protein